MGVTTRYREARGVWVVTETSNGKRHQRTFEAEKQAREYAARRHAELIEAEFNGTMGRQERRSFMEGLARWVEEYDVSSQANSIQWVARWFEYHAPGVLIGQETLDAARRMQKEVKASGKSQSTINNRTQVVKRVLSLAYREWDWIDRPLDAKLRKPMPRNARHVYLSEDEIRALVAAIPDHREVDRRLVVMACLTGLRRGELLSLVPSNIQDGRIVLRPNQTKNGKARVVPVPDEAMGLLAELPFPTTDTRLRNSFEKARAIIGRPDLRFHDLRHTYASILANAGETMTTVQALLGHSSLTVTSRYAHFFDAKLDGIQDKLPRICDQNATTAEASKGLKLIKR
ncbi:tyrosine-type recombinase/integrase [Vreelandella andesensis]|nr:site-specific integrase [Halomonas andesensis]